jgi:hypothetical protein
MIVVDFANGFVFCDSLMDNIFGFEMGLKDC